MMKMSPRLIQRYFSAIERIDGMRDLRWMKMMNLVHLQEEDRASLQQMMHKRAGLDTMTVVKGAQNIRAFVQSLTLGPVEGEQEH